MSVTLFYCPQCDYYTTLGATVKLQIDVDLNASRARLFACVRVSLPADGFSLDDIVHSHCPKCGGPTKLVAVNKCPHRWNIHPCDAALRICAFCGEEWRGRVVFVKR